MHASADRLEFAPPQQPGMVRAFALAVVAHLLLMIALTWGINWNRQSENLTAEAELWAATPQQAAPKLVEAPPPPPVEKKVEAAPPPPAPVVKDADIALEREKRRQDLAKQRQEELERLKKLEAKKKQEDLKREQLAAKKAAEDRKKQEEQAKTAKTKKQLLAEQQKMDALRQENLSRMMKGLPGGTGAPTSIGTAARSAGPSPSYAGRVIARVRPNIVFTDDISGNPSAEVEVRTSPDGTIVSSRIIKGSGVASWDNAVLRALVKTEMLPRDVDGRVPTPMIIEFKPKG